jgi:hypothetical protein
VATVAPPLAYDAASSCATVAQRVVVVLAVVRRVLAQQRPRVSVVGVPWATPIRARSRRLGDPCARGVWARLARRQDPARAAAGEARRGLEAGRVGVRISVCIGGFGFSTRSTPDSVTRGYTGSISKAAPADYVGEALRDAGYRVETSKNLAPVHVIFDDASRGWTPSAQPVPCLPLDLANAQDRITSTDAIASGITSTDAP